MKPKKILLLAMIFSTAIKHLAAYEVSGDHRCPHPKSNLSFSQSCISFTFCPLDNNIPVWSDVIYHWQCYFYFSGERENAIPGLRVSAFHLMGLPWQDCRGWRAVSCRTGSVLANSRHSASPLLELLMVILALRSRCLERLGLWARKAGGVVFEFIQRGFYLVETLLGLSQRLSHLRDFLSCYCGGHPGGLEKPRALECGLSCVRFLQSHGARGRPGSSVHGVSGNFEWAAIFPPGIPPTEGLDLHLLYLLHCRDWPLCHVGSPKSSMCSLLYWFISPKVQRYGLMSAWTLAKLCDLTGVSEALWRLEVTPKFLSHHYTPGVGIGKSEDAMPVFPEFWNVMRMEWRKRNLHWDRKVITFPPGPASVQGDCRSQRVELGHWSFEPRSRECVGLSSLVT